MLLSDLVNLTKLIINDKYLFTFIKKCVIIIIEVTPLHNLNKGVVKYDHNRKIKNELLKRTNNGANDCIITMKTDNQEVTISPCTQCGQVEYWLTYGFTRNGFSTLDELAKYIANYENEKKAHKDEIDKITKYFNEEISQGKGDWDWYSDWHKDVFGFRPHGMVCGQYINPCVIV